jgi:hypothetical protein
MPCLISPLDPRPHGPDINTEGNRAVESESPDSYSNHYTLKYKSSLMIHVVVMKCLIGLPN